MSRIAITALSVIQAWAIWQILDQHSQTAADDSLAPMQTAESQVIERIRIAPSAAHIERHMDTALQSGLQSASINYLRLMRWLRYRWLPSLATS